MPARGHQDIHPDDNPTGEALLERARPPFRIWVPKGEALVLGHSQDAEKEVQAEAVILDGIPLYRRMGGGGAVLLSPACVCVALRFAKRKGRTIHEYFESGSGLIKRAVAAATRIELETRGISDLAHAGPAGLRKVVGCSLYMPRDFTLYLASIMIHPDIARIERYLAHPSKEPDYRSGRNHGDFIVGLRELSGRDLESADLVPHLEAAMEPDFLRELDWPVPE